MTAPTTRSNAQAVITRAVAVLREHLDDELTAIRLQAPWTTSGVDLPSLDNAQIYEWDFAQGIEIHASAMLVTLRSEQFSHRAMSDEVDVQGEYVVVTRVTDAATGVAADPAIVSAASYAYGMAAAACLVRNLREDGRAEYIDRVSYVSVEVAPTTESDGINPARFAAYTEAVVRVQRRTTEPFPS